MEEEKGRRERGRVRSGQFHGQREGKRAERRWMREVRGQQVVLRDKRGRGSGRGRRGGGELELKSSFPSFSLPLLPSLRPSFQNPRRPKSLQVRRGSSSPTLEEHSIAGRELKKQRGKRAGESFVLISISHPSHEKTAALHSATKWYHRLGASSAPYTSA